MHACIYMQMSVKREGESAELVSAATVGIHERVALLLHQRADPDSSDGTMMALQP